MLSLRQMFHSRYVNNYTFSIACAVLLLCLWSIEHNIPKILWYKLGPNGMNDDTRAWTSTCITNNPEYRVEFMTDETADEYVQRTFSSSRPDIVESYLNISIPILKADLLRYLLLWDQGGVWSDLDVSCEADNYIDEWIPLEHRDKAGLVVGWEFDMGYDRPILRQFASWTIMARPRSPHMLQIIDDIVHALEEKVEEHHVPLQNLTLAMTGDVVDFTGPRRMTFGIYKSLGKILNRPVGQEEIQELLQPKMIGDVLVLPGRSFAASCNTYKPEEEELLPRQLITHHYAGSWKNDKGGESKQAH
ncbi:hypothetical protein EJ05DRAFT_530188 [Pseudovirgaria hyperparasitica]|uniref:Glycosyltransferase family 32 protein n=1 Tax=Pseudovirgaria hyperparasitica TaxID=470096 RepID=A0A6A6WMI0_9PEZI|nr:uncharacterized protein EJ05DRAFT_530188 [Pseudovirgaria hyperparasitica]KAF2763358.1 hypothetical protein EJ05DRAFT_530188 [Pseudovirgaria hyperparasitica]